MLYVIAFFLPPLAMLLNGQAIKAGVNLLLCLTLVGIPFAMIWAMIEISSKRADKRNERLIKALKR